MGREAASSRLEPCTRAAGHDGARRRRCRGEADAVARARREGGGTRDARLVGWWLHRCVVTDAEAGRARWQVGAGIGPRARDRSRPSRSRRRPRMPCPNAAVRVRMLWLAAGSLGHASRFVGGGHDVRSEQEAPRGRPTGVRALPCTLVHIVRPYKGPVSIDTASRWRHLERCRADSSCGSFPDGAVEWTEHAAPTGRP